MINIIAFYCVGGDENFHVSQLFAHLLSSMVRTEEQSRAGWTGFSTVVTVWATMEVRPVAVEV